MLDISKYVPYLSRYLLNQLKAYRVQRPRVSASDPTLHSNGNQTTGTANLPLITYHQRFSHSGEAARQTVDWEWGQLDSRDSFD